MDPPGLSFEQYASERLMRDRERITRGWIETLSRQLDVDPERVLPHRDVLDDIPMVLEKAAKFLLTPESELLTGERLVTSEMRSIARLRLSQGYRPEEIIREFDELAQCLDGAALGWLDDYPGSPDPKAVGRVFGRLNRVPLLMGQITVGTLEQERAELQRQLSRVEEQERIRLSRELHDHLGQLVTGLQLGLAMHRAAASATGRAAQIDELAALVDQIARGIHEIALDLRPAGLSNLGLAAALESSLQDWAAQTGVEIDFVANGVKDTQFSPEVEIAIYRVVQEGLTNVAKHAAANRVSLLVDRSQGDLRIVLEDDGKGFETAEVLVSPERGRRLGLQGMRERVTQLGGTLAVESSPGSGTALFARIPLST